MTLLELLLELLMIMEFLTGAGVLDDVLDCLHMLWGSHIKIFVKICWVYRHPEPFHKFPDQHFGQFRDESFDLKSQVHDILPNTIFLSSFDPAQNLTIEISTLSSFKQIRGGGSGQVKFIK